MNGPRRLIRRRARGQSIPLIAIMIVVLVAMVGLSVDVGNTFQTERQAVSAANAASLAGMNSYLRRIGTTRNETIYRAIIDSLNSNGIEIAGAGANTRPAREKLQLEAFYLNSEGEPLASGGRITSNPGAVPANVAYIQVNLKGNVDTYFARVVNRNDLPVNATSYAGACPAGEGIYPIAIDNNLLEGNRFKNPGDVDGDGVVENNWREIRVGSQRYSAMRVEVKNGTPGGFSWLRWRDSVPGANSSPTLEQALTIPGTLLQGFEEAPWPDENVPDDYPEQPGTMNVGDWIYGSTGYRSNADDKLNIHRGEGTRMVLPIYDAVVGTGSNARYRLVDFGIFILNEHGQLPQGGAKYIDLTFIGRDTNQKVACSYSAAPDPSPTYNLLGEIQIRPEYGFQPNNRDPIQYVVVLDVSGSMSANFDGQCNQSRNGSGLWQCANGPEGPNGTIRATVTGTGPDYWWGNPNERRIKVAKDAIESLVRETNMPANSGYDPTRPEDQMAIVWFTSTVNQGNGNISRFGSSNFSSNVGSPTTSGTLLHTVRNAGNLGSDTYRTSGGTNGAAGLYRAALAYDSVPKRVTRDGRTWNYKRVVIFITDGVSNHFLNRSASNLHGGQSDRNSYLSSHTACYTSLVVEIASCQVTGNGTTGGGRTPRGVSVAEGMDRPITQAGQVSRQDLQANGAEVFVVALSNIPSTGLQDTIASFPSHYALADKLSVVDGRTNVQKIMEQIITKVEGAPCEPRSDAATGQEFRGNIPAAHFPANGVSLPDLGTTLVYPHVGNVSLRNIDNNVSYTIPILADPATGALTYRKNDIPKGNYRMSAYVFYKHPLDLPTAGARMYGNIFSADETNNSIVVAIGTAGSTSVGLGSDIKQDLQLKLTGDACGLPAE
jgi:hypothetical protein